MVKPILTFLGKFVPGVNYLAAAYTVYQVGEVGVKAISAWTAPSVPQSDMRVEQRFKLEHSALTRKFLGEKGRSYMFRLVNSWFEEAEEHLEGKYRKKVTHLKGC